MGKRPFRSLEEDIVELQQKATSTSLSIREILQILADKGRPLFLLLLGLPFCQPIPLPGLSVLFGLTIAIIGGRMALGKGIWLPEIILNKKVDHSILSKITSSALALIKRIRPWIHPRYEWLCQSPVVEVLNGIIILVMGILLALPLPIPFSNLTAGWSIFLLALGMLEDDGYLILGAYFVCLLTFAFFLGIYITLNNVF